MNSRNDAFRSLREEWLAGLDGFWSFGAKRTFPETWVLRNHTLLVTIRSIHSLQDSLRIGPVPRLLAGW